jgi:hypothetical protein
MGKRKTLVRAYADTHKKFDCVEMKNKGGARVLKNLQGKTTEEQLRYWQRGTDDLRRHERRIRRRK